MVMNRNWIYIVLLSLLCLLLLSLCTQLKTIKRDLINTTTLNKTYRDKMGRLTNDVNTITVNNRRLKKHLDSLGLDKKSKGVVSIHTKSKIFIKGANTITYIPSVTTSHDTIYEPVYNMKFNTKWYNIITKSSKDSTFAEVEFFDTYHINYTQAFSLFRITPLKMTVKSDNPYIEQLVSDSYAIKPKTPLMNISLQSGGGVDILSGKPVIYAGIGFGLTLKR